MSWITREVAEHSQAKGPRRFVLVMLAEAVPRDKRETTISVPTIARRVNLTEARVREHLASLVRSGELIREGGGGRGVSAVSRIPQLCPDQRGYCEKCRPGKGAETGRVSPSQDPQAEALNGADPGEKGCQSWTTNGADPGVNPADTGTQVVRSVGSPHASPGVGGATEQILGVLANCPSWELHDGTAAQVETARAAHQVSDDQAIACAHTAVTWGSSADWKTQDAGRTFAYVLEKFEPPEESAASRFYGAGNGEDRCKCGQPCAPGIRRCNDCETALERNALGEEAVA